MPSEQGNSQTTQDSLRQLQTSQPVTFQSSPSNGKPLPAGNLDLIPSAPGESPLDFLKKNSTIETLRAEVPQSQQKTPEEIFKEVEKKENAPGEQAPLKKAVEPSFDSPKEATSPTSKEATKPAENLDSEDAFAEEVLANPESPAKESFKKLHTKLKTTTQVLKEKETALEKAERELKALQTGEAMPEVIEKKEQEIKRLSTFEKLYNLESSSEYQEKFVTPLNQKKEKLKTIFSGYDIPAEAQENLLNNVLNFKSEKELNNFLAENFDHIGGLEVKGLVNEIKSLSGEMTAARAEPAKILEQLTTQANAAREQQEAGRKIKIYETAKSSWRNAVGDIRAEGKVPELIPTHDEAFNKEIVEPIMAQAAKDFENMVKDFTAAGAKDIPEATLKALAKSCLLSLASGVAMSSRSSAVKYAENLEKGAERLNGILRPSIGGGTPRSSASAPAKATTPEQDAQAITQNILSKRR